MKKIPVISQTRTYIKLNYINDKLISTEKETVLIKSEPKKDKVLVLK